MKRDYTLVLKGTMALSRTRFPRGTLSPMLDAMARAPLWAEGIDFGHGTGHGVGYFLNVHEGPQSISKAVPDARDGDGARHDHQHRARRVPPRASGACASRTWCSTCRPARPRRRSASSWNSRP
jgi:Xaa-Pro aminopeptidase